MLNRMRGLCYSSSIKTGLLGLVVSAVVLMHFSKIFHTCERSRIVVESVSDVKEKFYRPFEHARTRLDRLHYGCQSEWNKSFILRYNQTNIRFDYSKEANLSVCSVPKAGSTLVALVLLALELPKGTNIDTIFQTQRRYVHAKSSIYLRKAANDDTLPTRIVIVARDPYRRLFSAYVDKEILRLPVSSTNSSKLICGRHFTFNQFLNFVLANGMNGKFVDRHVAPVTLLCKACEMSYEFVAKQETLSEDLAFLLENVTHIPNHTREAILSLLHGELNEKTIIGVIETVVTRAFGICSNMLDYISFVWSVFQIQGVLRNDAVFPLESLEQLGTVDVSSVTSLILRAIASHPLSSEERDQQRRAALVAAYAGVSPRTIRGIQDMYFKDFLSFGYDPLPPS